MYSKELEITFNGVVLNNLITPSFSTDSAMLPETADTTLSFLGTIGENFRRRKYGKRTITIPCIMHNPTEAKRQALIAALSVSEPKKLVLGRTPDRYYNAIPKNSTFAIAGYKTTGTLEFECYDGLAHSFDELPTTGTSGEPITVTNSGTAPTAPIMTATMIGDNGLVAWTNSAGAVLQFGSPSELDKVAAQDSERAEHIKFDASEEDKFEYNTGILVRPNYLDDPAKPNENAGSIEFGITEPDGTVSAEPVFKTDSTSQGWTGPNMRLDLPSNKGNDRTTTFALKQQFYWASGVGNVGGLEFLLETEDPNNPAIYFAIQSMKNATDDITINWGNGRDWDETAVFNRNQIPNGYYQLSFTRVDGTITIDLSTVGLVNVDTAEGLTSRFRRSYDFTNLTGLARWPITGWGMRFMKWPALPAAKMYVADMTFDWLNVEWMKDVPNRFRDGDVVTADVAQKKVYLNGVEDRSLQTVGNQWDSFVLPAGESVIQPVASDWAQPFDAKIEYREAWY